MVSTNKVCRSDQSMIFTHYQQKPSKHIFLDNVYFSDIQINKWLHISSSLWGISLRNFTSMRHVKKKNSTEKFPFITKNNSYCINRSRVCKIFFDPNFLIFWKSSAEEKKLAIPKHFASQANAKKIFFVFVKMDFENRKRFPFIINNI